MVMEGLASSFVIVPSPCASLIDALPGLKRLTKNVSFGYVVTSPVTRTLTVFVVCPGVKVRLPLEGW